MVSYKHFHVHEQEASQVDQHRVDRGQLSDHRQHDPPLLPRRVQLAQIAVLPDTSRPPTLNGIISYDVRIRCAGIADPSICRRRLAL